MHPEYAQIGDIHFKVMEEVGEVLQAYGKMGRFGALSKHPNFPDGLNNAEQLIMECEDVITRMQELKAYTYTLLAKESDESFEVGDDPDYIQRLESGIIEIIEPNEEKC